MDLLLLVVIVLFVVIMEHIKTWSKTLILSKVKTVKLFNLGKTSTALISVYMPLVVIYAVIVCDIIAHGSTAFFSLGC